MIGVTIRDAINDGLIPGPRMRAASPKSPRRRALATSGGATSTRKASDWWPTAPSRCGVLRVNARATARDNLKINISGDEFVSHARAEITTLEDDELQAFVSVAHNFGKMVAAHARSSKSVKMAVRHKVDCIYHCDFADEEALDLLESVKDESSWALHSAWCTTAHRGRAYGFSRELAESMHLFRKFEATCATYHEIRRRGIRVVIGGDYGFSITPMGQNARDIGHFVKYFGYAPADALRCATKIGAELMGHGGELGVIREGALADCCGRRQSAGRSIGAGGAGPLPHDHEGRQPLSRSAAGGRPSAAGRRRVIEDPPTPDDRR